MSVGGAPRTCPIVVPALSHLASKLPSAYILKALEPGTTTSSSVGIFTFGTNKLMTGAPCRPEFPAFMRVLPDLPAPPPLPADPPDHGVSASAQPDQYHQQQISSYKCEPHVCPQKPEGVVNEALQQIAYADRIVLNKIDLVSAEQLQDLEARLKTINSLAQVLGRVRV